MPKTEPIEVAFKVCETCNNYEISFCVNCHEEVSDYNRCPNCNKFVKTQPCPDCMGWGCEEEYRAGDDIAFYVGVYSSAEHKKFVDYKGNTFKSYKAKVIRIIKENLIEIRVKGKNIIVKTEDL